MAEKRDLPLTIKGQHRATQRLVNEAFGEAGVKLPPTYEARFRKARSKFEQRAIIREALDVKERVEEGFKGRKDLPNPELDRQLRKGGVPLREPASTKPESATMQRLRKFDQTRSPLEKDVGTQEERMLSDLQQEMSADREKEQATDKFKGNQQRLNRFKKQKGL